MQAKVSRSSAWFELGQFPGFVLGVLTTKAAAIAITPISRLQDRITAAGSSTHFMARYLMAQAGLKTTMPPSSTKSARADGGRRRAARRNRRLVNVDPGSAVGKRKGHQGRCRHRTLEGTRQVYGGNYPAAVIYVTPAYAQAKQRHRPGADQCVVRGLRWIAAHSPQRSPM